MKSLLVILSIFVLLSCNSKHNQNNENVDSTKVQATLGDHSIISQEPNNRLIKEEDIFESEDTVFEIDTLFYEIALSPKGNYKVLKKQITWDRNKFLEEYMKCQEDSTKLSELLDSARIYITEKLVNTIIPFWYGMPWDFSGYSAIPNEGSVGCSYFVSNTMKHCGFNLNRYKLAQQNTKNIALSIQTDTNIWFTENLDYEFDKMKFINEKRAGLYYIGLNSHVGYLLYRKGELFFIQSSYGSNPVVVIEPIDKSDVFGSDLYYVSDITWNNKLIMKWILNEEIAVVKN